MVRKEDEALAKTIGGNARALRLKLESTQEELAEAVGLSPQVYSRLERGGVLPSLGTLMRLCTAFEVTPDRLILAERQLMAADPARTGPSRSRLERIVGSLGHDDAKLLLALARRLQKPARRRGSGRK